MAFIPIASPKSHLFKVVSSISHELFNLNNSFLKLFEFESQTLLPQSQAKYQFSDSNFLMISYFEL